MLKESQAADKPLKMRDLASMNYYELGALKALIGSYKSMKAESDQTHFMFANAIYILLNLEMNPKFRLSVVLTEEMIEQINSLSKTAKK